MAETHFLKPERATLHGHFSPNLQPVLTIESGDTVVYSTLDASWGIEPHIGGAYQPRKVFAEKMDGALDSGHALVGPIAIQGAQPNLTLEIQIKAIRPAAWGWCLAGGWPSLFNQRYGTANEVGIAHAWTLDADTLTGRNHLGHTIKLSPFMGVMGMPPAESGVHSTIPPRVWGGNMDCKELVVGSRLYLSIPVEGGLFSVGDGHGRQGDGEVSGTAIECGMERVELTFHVRDDFPITTPIANTPAGWLTMGFDENLNEAAFMALESMFGLMQQ